MSKGPVGSHPFYSIPPDSQFLHEIVVFYASLYETFDQIKEFAISEKIADVLNVIGEKEARSTKKSSSIQWTTQRSRQQVTDQLDSKFRSLSLAATTPMETVTPEDEKASQTPRAMANKILIQRQRLRDERQRRSAGAVRTGSSGSSHSMSSSISGMSSKHNVDDDDEEDDDEEDDEQEDPNSKMIRTLFRRRMKLQAKLEKSGERLGSLQEFLRKIKIQEEDPPSRRPLGRRSRKKSSDISKEIEEQTDLMGNIRAEIQKTREEELELLKQLEEKLLAAQKLHAGFLRQHHALQEQRRKNPPRVASGSDNEEEKESSERVNAKANEVSTYLHLVSELKDNLTALIGGNDDDYSEDEEVPAEGQPPPTVSSREFYEEMGKRPQVLLTITLGLKFEGSDFRKSPYDRLGEDAEIKQPTRSMLQNEVQRRARALALKPSNLPNFQVRGNVSTRTIVDWLMRNPINDDYDQYFERETKEFIKTLPMKEVDAFQNPTALYRMIQNQEYYQAKEQLKKNRKEAWTWVVSKRDRSQLSLLRYHVQRSKHSSLQPGGTPSVSRSLPRRPPTPLSLGYSIRQLPIHTACGFLSRFPQEGKSVTSTSAKQKEHLEALIRGLAFVYKEGCILTDQDGKLPLHDAIRYEASPRTIAVLLSVYPSALHKPDRYGRTPADMVSLRTDDSKSKIMQMVHQGTTFWEDVWREKCQQRAIKKGFGAVPTKVGQKGGKEVDGPPLMYSKGHPSSQRSTSLHAGGRTPAGKETEDDAAMEALRERIAELEQKLTILHAKKFESDKERDELGRRVVELGQDLTNLEIENERLQRPDPPENRDTVRSQWLHEENRQLKGENENLRELAEDLGKLIEDRGAKSDASSEEKIRALEARNERLEEDVDALTRANQAYKERVAKLEPSIKFFETSRKYLDERSRDESGDSMSRAGKSRDIGDAVFHDFTDLLAAIGSDAPRGVERHLAKKVQELHERLADQVEEADNERKRAQAELARQKEEFEAERSRQEKLLGKWNEKRASLPSRPREIAVSGRYPVSDVTTRTPELSLSSASTSASTSEPKRQAREYHIDPTQQPDMVSSLSGSDRSLPSIDEMMRKSGSSNLADIYEGVAREFSASDNVSRGQQQGQRRPSGTSTRRKASQ